MSRTHGIAMAAQSVTFSTVKFTLLGIVRKHHTKTIWRAYSISKIGGKSHHPKPPREILSREPKNLGSFIYGTKMVAIDLVDNPVKELFLTCTVFTQFENMYLEFLNISPKFDLLEKITLGPCIIVFGIF